MTRFFGMIPASEIVIEQSFTDSYGMGIVIQANTKGWTIIRSKSALKYKDVVNTADENYREAYNTASSLYGSLKSHNPWWE